MISYVSRMATWCLALPKLQWVPGSKSSLIKLDEQLRSSLTHKNYGKWVPVNHNNETHDIWTVTVEGENRHNAPIVVIHGMGGGANMFLKNIDSFAKQRDVILIDLPGFGLSSRPDLENITEENGTSRKTNEDDIEQFYTNVMEKWFNTMKLDEVILMGHSFGGYVSSIYCLSHPKRIKHLILADPWGYNRQRKIQPTTMKWKVILFLINKLYDKVNMFTPIRMMGPFGPRVFRSIRSDLNERYNPAGPDDTTFIDYLYACNTAGKPSGELGFSKLSLPLAFARKPLVDRVGEWCPDLAVTFIHGKDSWMRGYLYSEEVCDARPEGSYTDMQVIEDAGHHVHTDNAPAFNYLVSLIGAAVDQGTTPNLLGPGCCGDDININTS